MRRIPLLDPRSGARRLRSPGRRRALALATLPILGLGGCAVWQPIGDVSQPARPFELGGRIYVRGGKRAFSGNLRWMHRPDGDELWLGSPLGQTYAHLVGDARGGVLKTADGQTYTARSLEALAREGLGWTLPFRDLAWWVQGMLPPETSESTVVRGSDGLVERISTDAWTVRLARASGGGDGRPSRLIIQGGDAEVRLVIDRLEPR